MRLIPFLSVFVFGSLCSISALADPAAAPGGARQTAVITRSTFACTSWAAWREFTSASLTRKGARYDKNCPIRLKAGLKVEIVEDDAGAGATAVKAHGKDWYIDNSVLKYPRS
jgi:hypothetical protein